MTKSTTGAQHSFANIPAPTLERSVFDRSHGVKTTFDAGDLIPIFADEILPGDTINLNLSTYCRMATPIKPVLDNMYLETQAFFVPMRLLWFRWRQFMGQQHKPTDSTDYTIPVMDTAGVAFTEGSLGDYLGLPIGVTDLEDISAMFFRACNSCYNEWYRDPNLQDGIAVNELDGPDQISWFPVKKRGKRKDYFSGALPWPQKGEPVSLPLGTSAPVIGTGSPEFTLNNGITDEVMLTSAGGLGVTDIEWSKSPNGTGNAQWSVTNLETDLTDATAATINALRTATQLQRLFERDARGGTRYTELVKSHFGVTSPDSRLQRPEYIGGGSQQINFQAVAQTSETNTTEQGNLAAFAVSQGNNHNASFSATEHGIVLMFVSVRADLNYQQGVHKMWTRQTREEFYFPALAHLGEQAIENREIYAQGTSADTEVFGYQERWSEMRYKQGQITGAMRSTSAAPLDMWHLAQDFSSLPVLGDSFIQENPPVDRVVAVPSEPQFLFDGFFRYKHARVMPTYSVPGMMDHF